MKTHSEIQLFALIVISVLLAYSCKTPEIKPSDRMKYMHEIYEGEELALEWEFTNAEFVKVDGIAGEYNTRDAIIVKPDKSEIYKIVAYRGNRDSLVCMINVDVLAGEFHKGDIQTGEIVLLEKFNKVSGEESEYLAGKINEEQSEGAIEMKIVRFKNDNGAKTAWADILLLDRYGNFISDYDKKQNRIIWNATNLCGGITANYSNLDYREIGAGLQSESIDLSVLVENSRFSQYKDIDRSLLNALTGMKNQDNFEIAYFSEEFTPLTGLQPAEQAVLGFNEQFRMNGRKGFAATYDALRNSIDGLSSGNSGTKILVLIAYSNDNASLKTSAEDVIKVAKAKGVAIYVVGIGNSIAGYEFRDICSSTGGRYYLLLPDESDKIGEIISEIIFSIRNCYRISVPMQSFNRNCVIRSSTIQFVDSRRDLSATITIPEQISGYNNRGILACGFPKNSITISNDSYSNLNRIADWLKGNMDRIIVAGYGYNEGPPGNARRLAQLRAEAVKNYLSERGVRLSRFTVQTNIDIDPYYTRDEDDSLSELNRRVVLSFSEETKTSYEIIAENSDNEENASGLALDWEKKGYKAYFIRSSDISKLNYQVRLWGYSNKEDADKAAQTIKNKYKINPVVE